MTPAYLHEFIFYKHVSWSADTSPIYRIGKGVILSSLTGPICHANNWQVAWQTVTNSGGQTTERSEGSCWGRLMVAEDRGDHLSTTDLQEDPSLRSG
jgi:hypothetical protein